MMFGWTNESEAIMKIFYIDVCCWLGFAERVKIQLIVQLFYPNRSIEKVHIQ